MAYLYFYRLFDELKYYKSVSVKGAYIKYIGGEARGFYKVFKKFFVVQETKNLNISWPGNLFRKYFITSPINFSFLFKAYL